MMLIYLLISPTTAMSRLDALNGRRMAVGVLVGFGVGMAPVVVGLPAMLAGVGPFVAGVPIGVLADSRYDEVGPESAGAGAVTAVLLYAGVLTYLAALTWGVSGQGDLLFVAGTLGWIALMPLLVLSGLLGFLGGVVARLGGRLRG